MDAVSYSLASKQAQRIEKFIENPDSNSGVLTQPKVIEAGETVTIKSGRQAILADTVVDGDLVIEAGGDVFVPAGAGFGDLESQIALKADTSYVNDKYRGFKNYIINGDFKVNQRNSDTVAAITAAGIFPCDRFYGYASQPGKITAQIRSSGAVAMGQVQFEKCLQVLTVAGYSPNSAEQFNITQKIEGLNTANLRFGRSNAKTITLSFWVRSSVIGLHSVAFKNSVANRSYVATYTINSANTFEYKTITIQGDTTGTWEYDNGVGLHMSFNMAVGSSLATPTPNQWVSGNYSTTVGCVNDMATTGNEVILTGIQLEEGSVATPFENRPIGLEISLCQRYYNGSISLGIYSQASETRVIGGSGTFSPPMRVPPTMGLVAGNAVTYQNVNSSGTEYYSTVGAGLWNNGIHYASAEL